MSKRSVLLHGLILSMLLYCSLAANAQQDSKYGWALSPKDTLRVLLIFVEIDYDESPELEKDKEGSAQWKAGEMPLYADEAFDPFFFEEPVALLSKYYREISFGNLIVLGDYYPQLMRVPYSKIKTSPARILTALGEVFGTDTNFRTQHGFGPADFDFWEKSPGLGKEIPRSSGDKGADHVMIITRNYHRIPNETGQASPASSLDIAGRRSDTYSLFGGGDKLSFKILKHELNHLFLGSNNFHSGGGNGARFLSYFIGIQGGWSMMGAANSSLLTCSAWDRYRLGWKAQGNTHLISARNEANEEVNGDLDVASGTGEGLYLIRDFVRTGDALRIKLPYLPDSEFQQWIWVENHTTQAMNGSPFDRYSLEGYECTASMPAGLFMQMQVDADQKEGKGVFQSVNADYLRPMPANGFYDFLWELEPLKLEEYCVNGVDYFPYSLLPERENPLTGKHEQESDYRDFKAPYGVLTADEGLIPSTRRTPNGFERFNFLGGSNHAFRLDGNRGIGLGGNPASSNMLTLLNSRKPRKPDVRNNQTVYLNGINLQIVDRYPDGTIKVLLRYNDNMLEENRRWCAPQIVLNNHCQPGADLHVMASLTLARGESPGRFDMPDTLVNGEISFTDDTQMQVNDGAEVLNGGHLRLEDRSLLVFKSGATLNMLRKSRLHVQAGSVLSFESGAIFKGKGRLRISEGGVVKCFDEETCKLLRKRTCHKKRIALQAR
jgi:hypothetical protein